MRPVPQRPLSPQETTERTERDYLTEDRYWARQDREDDYTPSPDPWHKCPAHGLYQGVCQGCRTRKAAA